MKIKTGFAILLITITAITSVIIAVGAINIDHSVRSYLINQATYQTSLFVNTQALKHVPENSFSSTDLDYTQTIFGNFIKEIENKDILRIKVWDTMGRIIASDDASIVGDKFLDNEEFTEALLGQAVVDVKPKEKEENINELGYEQFMEIYIPIIYNNDVAGVVEVYYSLDSMEEIIWQGKFRQGLISTSILVTLILIYSIAITVTYIKIVRPINHLKVQVGEISSGEYGKTIEVKSRDEISDLANAFNEMAKKLNDSSNKSKALELDLKKNNQALKAKVKELNDFNKLMVGRELKMVEMKKKIKRLEADS